MTTPEITSEIETPVREDAAIQDLRTRLRGQVIGRADDGYEAARKVYNAMIDRRPYLIARCVDAADVIALVNFARENGLTLAVRGGGHSVPGFGTCDDGLVIDLSRMKGIRVDPETHTAWAQGGCTWGDLDHATHAFGLATPGGVVSTTGIAGLTLGGGVGHLSRKYGLSCDNLISADVVTADGRFLTASANENEDLFWSLRGGSGNFGVVTSFQYRLHPVSTVYAGPILYPLERAGDAMRNYRDCVAQAPEDLNALFAFVVVPPEPPFPQHLHNTNVCAVLCCYVGPMDKAEQVVRPLREFGPPIFDLVGPMPYPVVQSLFDATVPPGLQNYWKGDFVGEMSDQYIDVHVKYGPGVPNIHSGVHVFAVDGAVHRLGNNDTAFNYRDARFMHVIDGVYPDPADTPKIKTWVQNYWSELHPHSAGGAYVNFLGDEGEERVAASYRDNYERLAAIKAKYDPTNLFHVNQNIKPNGR